MAMNRARTSWVLFAPPLASGALWACSRTALDDDVSPSFDGAVVDTSLPDGTPDGSGSDAVNDNNSDTMDGVSDVKFDVVLTCTATCAFCCDSTGTCQQESATTCGGHGEACQDCTKKGAGWGCKSEVCLDLTGPSCSPTNCSDGCCFGSYCSSGTLSGACGTNGQPCDTCNTMKGDYCAPTDGGGVCSSGPPCGPMTCAGCCYGDVCSVGTQDFACGTGGATCFDCLFMGEHCTTGGVCSK
jgi:hypothetical protein